MNSTSRPFNAVPGRRDYRGPDLVREGRCQASVTAVQGLDGTGERQCRNVLGFASDDEGTWCGMHTRQAYEARASLRQERWRGRWNR